MPKETISAVSDPYRVQVGWRHDAEVQVGVSVIGDRSIFWSLFDERAMTRLGEQVAKMGPLGYDDDLQRGTSVLNTLDVVSEGGYGGLWSTLDRRGCNDLIRVLRRARDSAFGRDE